MGLVFIRRLSLVFLVTLLWAGLGTLSPPQAWAQNPTRIINCTAAAIPSVINVVRGDVLLFTGDVSNTDASTTFTLRGRTSRDSSDPFLGVRSWQLAWDSAKPTAKSGPYILSYSRDGRAEHQIAEFQITILDQAPFRLTTTSTGAAALTAQIAQAGPTLLRAVSYDLAIDGRTVGTGLDPARPGRVDLISQEPGDHTLQALVRTQEGGAYGTNSVPLSIAASVQLLGLDRNATVDLSDPAKPVAPLPLHYKADAGIVAQTVYLVVDGQNVARYDLPTATPMQLDPGRLSGGMHTVRLSVIADDGERFESLPVTLQVLAPVSYRRIDWAVSSGVQVYPYVELATRLANADAGELVKVREGDDAVAAILRPVPPPGTALETWWDTLRQPPAPEAAGATAASLWTGFRASLQALPLPADISEGDQATLRQAVGDLEALAAAHAKQAARGGAASPAQALSDARSQRDAALLALRENRPILDVLKKYGARDVPAERFVRQVTLASFEATQRIGRTTRSEFDSLAYWQWAAANPQVLAAGSLDPAKAAQEKANVVALATALASVVQARNDVLAGEAEVLPLLLQTPVPARAAALTRDVLEAAAHGQAALATLGAQEGATEGNQRRLAFNVRQSSQWFEVHAALVKAASSGALAVASLGDSPGYANPQTVERANSFLHEFSSLVVAPDASSEPLAASDGQSLGIRGLYQSLVALANVWGLRIALRDDDSLSSSATAIPPHPTSSVTIPFRSPLGLPSPGTPPALSPMTPPTSSLGDPNAPPD